MNNRPMPGPPPYGHYPNYYPHGHPDDALGLCPGCDIDDQAGRVQSAKRLTDAECAAEFWRAKAMLFYFDPHWDPEASSAAETAERTWNRFATLPHALEDTND